MAGLSIFRAEDALALSNSITILCVALSEIAALYFLYTAKSSKSSNPGYTLALAILGRRPEIKLFQCGYDWALLKKILLGED